MRPVRPITERVVLAFLAVAILWKGGKSLDVVWLLALVAGSLAFITTSARSASVPKPYLIILLALLSWTVLSFAFSSTLSYGFDELLQATSLSLLLMYGASRRQEDPMFASRFAQTVSAAGLIACGVGVVVYVLQPVSRFERW
jgi:hypothetical protein